MAKTTLLSIIESPNHGDYSPLFKELKLDAVRLSSMRKALGFIKKNKPNFIICDFMYGYSNNYAGINISNLDVFLFSLQKYSTESKIIVQAEKKEIQYVDKLKDIFPLHAVIQYPVGWDTLEKILK
jgi:hypothetical protein